MNTIDAKRALRASGIEVLEIARAFARHPTTAIRISASRPYSLFSCPRASYDPTPIYYAGIACDGGFAEVAATRSETEAGGLRGVQWVNDRHQNIAILSLNQNDDPRRMVCI